ncbi:hypothetical protein [Sphingomonas echinoides]|uniref:Uncharacterized protein n=1 Tax=Sphingomonas echinoides TaxID=59803 RepID=A0ABU4PLL4_9SPHN|nr:hypothetical protein [Sphingomonas echinoides]MDX5985078.1 hypothetical protein [Sphingomonas echinoides]
MTPGTTGASPATLAGGVFTSREPRDTGARRATSQPEADGIGGDALMGVYQLIELYERTVRARD